MTRGQATPSVMRSAAVHGADPCDFPLDGVADLFRHHRAERTPLVDAAARHGVASGRALAVRVNHGGLESPAWCGLLGTLAARVAVDLDHDHQVVLATGNLTGFLSQLLDGAGDARSALVRDVVDGDVGAISYWRSPDDELVVEWSPDGLLALTRGVAASVTSVALQHGGRVNGALPPDWTGNTLETLRSVSADFAAGGHVLLEWASIDGHLQLVDYSPVVTEPPDGAGQGSGGIATIISAGGAQGPALVVDPSLLAGLAELVTAPIAPDPADLADIARLIALPNGAGAALIALRGRIQTSATAPILVVDRPLSILGAVLDVVAGVVVLGPAPLLGQLAVALREHRVPAVSAPGRTVESGQTVAVTGDGHLRIETRS